MSEQIHIPVFPVKRPRGLQPIGFPAHLFEPDAMFFLDRLGRVAARDDLCALLCDMHRLIYIGEKFTRPGILRCLRLYIGRTQATWTEGCIDMLAAEEKAQPKPKTCDDMDLSGPEDHQL
jgi:hypothetical protein